MATAKIVDAIDRADAYGPILRRLSKWLDKPKKTGRPLTKKQNKALMEFMRSQAGAIWGKQFKDAIEDNDLGRAMLVLKELIALDIEEIKVGKKTKKKEKIKPGLNVFIPELNESPR